jgi:phosphopantothenoylcysteine synthetase/decarboxylase
VPVRARFVSLLASRFSLLVKLSAMRSVLIVGGAPRVAVDAVRYLTVAASGVTALALERRLREKQLTEVDLLLSADAAPGVQALRYSDRAKLELGLRTWIAAHRDGVVVMSAAVNDYEVASVEMRRGGATERIAAGAKLKSGADEAVIRLRPAGKVIDQLRGWGLAGPLVGFKYEARETVLASAAALRARVGAALVVANSICGSIQALVLPDGVDPYPDRDSLLDQLAIELERLAKS